MPSTYAHYKFGQMVFDSLSMPEKEILFCNKDLFDVGLQGPDILFYYQPLVKNPISRLGAMLHEKPAIYFFGHAGRGLKRRGYLPEDLAYLYGVLCHFALDYTCHGYIDRYAEENGVSHAIIESELDRTLLMAENRNPIEQDLSVYLHSDDEQAKTIRHFYPTLSVEQVKQSIDSMIFYHKVLCAPQKAKRKVLFTALKVIGKYDSLGGHFIAAEEHPLCEESNRVLQEKMNEAKRLALKLIENYLYAVKGSDTFMDVYRYNFESNCCIDILEEEDD